ncbi:hypothetical protein F4821DRAFT_250655, partial [Hypoxylon rubiginosum]
MKTTFAVTILLALASAVALSDASPANGMARRDDDIKDVYKDLKDDGKIDKKGTILLTKSGIVSLGARPEVKTGDGSSSDDAAKQLAKKDVEDADDLIKKFKKLREDKMHEPKKSRRDGGDVVRRGEGEGDVCKSNGDCDDDQPMCAGVEGLAGPNVCMKLD